MTKIKIENAKGTKDWYGQEVLIREEIRETLRNIFQRYGYDGLETPPIEKKDVLGFKGGGEIQKEVFRLKDQGQRDLALRFDQTVPFARYIASNQEIKFPFKRYAIGQVFRDGPTQPEQGRYRIFTQCDVDVAGVPDMTAEAELLGIATDAFRELGLGGVEVNINNRKLLEGILDFAEVPIHSRIPTIVTLDKLDKIGLEGVESELRNLYLSKEEIALSGKSQDKLFEFYDSEGAKTINNPKIQKMIISELGTLGYNHFKQLFSQNKKRETLISEVATYATRGEKLLEEKNVDKIIEIMKISGNNQEIYSKLEKLISSKKGEEGLNEIKEILEYSQTMNFDFVKFNPSLARGLDYYTGTTLEVYLKNREIMSSAILAGGRFDDMIGDFKGKGETIPAVGFSFGLERLAMILAEQKDFPKTAREIYLIPIGETQGECLKIANKLRGYGLNVDMKLKKGGKVGKAIEYAVNQGIPYIGLIGTDEINSGAINIKNLQNAKQKAIPIDEVYNYVKKK